MTGRAALWHRLPANFEDQLDAVVASGRVSEYHFDDGYNDVLRAADALEARGLRGVFFIVSGWLGLDCQATGRQVVDLARRGHVIGNHTAHHIWAPKVSATVLTAEILWCQAALADLTGTLPRRFAWPYGLTDRACDFLADMAGAWDEDPRGIGPAEVYAPRSATPAQIAATLA